MVPTAAAPTPPWARPPDGLAQAQAQAQAQARNEDLTLLQSLLPAQVLAAQAWIDDRTDWPGQCEAERIRMARATPARRAEHAAGRWCARQALHALADRLDPPAPDGSPVAPPGPSAGTDDTPHRSRPRSAVRDDEDAAWARQWRSVTDLPAAADRQPLWPAGCRGSIAHDAGLALAVVADARGCAALGVDVEQRDRLLDPDRLSALILTPSERLAHDALAEPAARALRLLQTWCAKEAVFKAWHPATGRWLEPRDIELCQWPQTSAGTFIARLPATASGQPLAGRLAWNARRCVALVHRAARTGA
ncbi:MAG: hypothetical protein RL223_3184 [Pseudomonadota bacterium]